MPYTIAPNPGTISVAAGSTDIVGSGTAFTTLRKGAIIYVPGIWGGQLAADPADDTHATLVLPIVPAGGDDVTGAAYGAIPLSDAIVYSERVRQLIELLSSGVVEQIATLSLVPGKVLGVDDGGGLTMLNPPTLPGTPLAFDDDTSAGDPGAGKFRLSADGLALSVSYTDAGGADITGFVQSFDDVANAAVRATLDFAPTDGANAFMSLSVTGALTDHTSYATIPVSLAIGALPADGAKLALTMTPAGKDGAPGTPGANGIFSAIASQAEAEAGTESTKGMTAQRVAQAILAQAPVSTKYGRIKVTTFTSSGTWTPDANMITAIIDGVGAGGAGGGVSGLSGVNFSGGGGQSGGHSMSVVTKAAAGASQAVTIGSGGSGVSAGNGGAGSDTSVGTLMVAKGGAGGGVGQAGTPGTPGYNSAIGTGNILTVPGNPGGAGMTSTTVGVFINSGFGGNSAFGPGAPAVITLAASSGTNAFTGLGGGGSGACIDNSATAGIGGTGAAGRVIIIEFCSQ